MPSILLTGPAIEPWSIEEAKRFLRAENDDDDAVIASLIAAARSHVEAMTRCALIAQTWRLVLDQWPNDGRIKPGRGQLRALTAARVYDSAGIATPIDAGTFVLDKVAGVIVSSVWVLPGRANAPRASAPHGAAHQARRHRPERRDDAGQRADSGLSRCRSRRPTSTASAAPRVTSRARSRARGARTAELVMVPSLVQASWPDLIRPSINHDSIAMDCRVQ